MNLPERILVREVGPRDGFQIEKEWIPTDSKIAVIDALSEAGVPMMEVTSFTHPKWVPQLRDAEEVMARIKRLPTTKYVALVPNAIGAKRAIASGAEGFGVGISASDTHQRKNFNMSIRESLTVARQVFDLGKEAGLRLHAGVAMAFGCPLEGEVPVDQVLWILDELLDIAGGEVEEVGLSDTSGMGNPRQVANLVALVRQRYPNQPVGLHIHDTRGLGLANVLAAMQEGATRFDASLGGMGGCPYAPGATGNIDTIDLVHMLHEMGIETGIDLDKLVGAGQLLEGVMGRQLHSSVLRAGTNRSFRERPMNTRTGGGGG